MIVYSGQLSGNNCTKTIFGRFPRKLINLLVHWRKAFISFIAFSRLLHRTNLSLCRKKSKFEIWSQKYQTASNWVSNRGVYLVFFSLLGFFSTLALKREKHFVSEKHTESRMGKRENLFFFSDFIRKVDFWNFSVLRRVYRDRYCER